MQLRTILHINRTITIKNNKPQVTESKFEVSKNIAYEVRKDEDNVIKNNYRSPAARKELNKYISQITITNSLRQTSNGTTDRTTPNFAYTKEVSMGDIKNTKQ